MYMEVAFDPACMADMEYYCLVKQHFGFEKGRYIAADVKAWAREAMRHVKDSDLQPIKKQSIKNYLNKLGRSKCNEEFVLTEDRKGLNIEEWNSWWQEQRKIREFSITISESNTDGCINVDQINSGCDEWQIPPSVSVSRTAHDIVKVLLPLALISEEITIIDQHFRLVGNAVLVEIFNRIANSSVRKLRIITAMETANVRGTYDKNYRSLNALPIRFEWIKAPDKFFHDRYFITNVGAIRSGHGFMADVEKGSHADLANLNIISRAEALRTLSGLEELFENGKASQVLSI
ncbi:MAG: hypothetical protein IBX56_17500 [Methylomicrobium sp.]|nr:hypothetical protein [Methylomicrobium sp.]